MPYKNPNYMKEYYLKNIEKFRERDRNRPKQIRKSSKQHAFMIEINGQKYIFHNRKDIKPEKVLIKDLHSIDCIIVN